MLVLHGALVLALDQARLQLPRNRGSDRDPDLEPVSAEKLHDCGTASPRIGESRVREVIDAVDPLIAGSTPLILVAPPDMLDALRYELSPPARRHIVAEIAKDLAPCSPSELADRLHAVLK